MTTVKKCYYQVMQIKRSATNDQVKKSFRKLAVKLHPDKNPDNKEMATERFKQLSEAYEVLSDDVKKREYDTYGHGGPQKQTSNTYTNNRADDLFKSFFTRFGFESSYDEQLFGNRYGGSSTYFSRKSSMGGGTTGQPTYGSMGSNYEEILKNHFGAGSTGSAGSSAGYSRTASYGTDGRYKTATSGTSYAGNSYGGTGGRTYVRVNTASSGGSGYGSYGSFSGQGTTIGGDQQVPKQKRYARFQQQQESNDTATEEPNQNSNTTQQAPTPVRTPDSQTTTQSGNTKVQTSVKTVQGIQQHRNGLKVTTTKTTVTNGDGSRNFTEQIVQQNVPGRTIRKYTLPAGCPDLVV